MCVLSCQAIFITPPHEHSFIHSLPAAITLRIEHAGESRMSGLCWVPGWGVRYRWWFDIAASGCFWKFSYSFHSGTTLAKTNCDHPDSSAGEAAGATALSGLPLDKLAGLPDVQLCCSIYMRLSELVTHIGFQLPHLKGETFCRQCWQL